jgi:hypothetical protein
VTRQMPIWEGVMLALSTLQIGFALGMMVFA